uniref:Uncharacterized protein n=1 Tax=Anguilla anguilla TaxID=7936 RepID=A0A0E9V1E4_ANGAN
MPGISTVSSIMFGTNRILDLQSNNAHVIKVQIFSLLLKAVNTFKGY